VWSSFAREPRHIAPEPSFESPECESAWSKTHHRRAMRTHRAYPKAIPQTHENDPPDGPKLNADVGQSSRPIHSEPFIAHSLVQVSLNITPVAVISGFFRRNLPVRLADDGLVFPLCGRDPAYVALELGTYRSQAEFDEVERRKAPASATWGESAASPSVPAVSEARRDPIVIAASVRQTAWERDYIVAAVPALKRQPGKGRNGDRNSRGRMKYQFVLPSSHFAQIELSVPLRE
jgi:hypothetical protein